MGKWVMAESTDSCIRLLPCERLNSLNFLRLQDILGNYGWWQLTFLKLLPTCQQPSSHLSERLLSSCPPQEATFLSVLLSCLSRGCYLPVLSSQHKRGVVAMDNRQKLFRKGRFINQRDSWICCLQKIAVVSAWHNLLVNEARWEVGIR